MSQIADIENAISQMNLARFQELGDILITRSYPNAAIFACVGSQFGLTPNYPKRLDDKKIYTGPKNLDVIGTSRKSGAWIWREVLNLRYENLGSILDVPPFGS